MCSSPIFSYIVATISGLEIIYIFMIYLSPHMWQIIFLNFFDHVVHTGHNASFDDFETLEKSAIN